MKKKIYSERFDIRLPSTLLKEAEKHARERHLTMSQLIRDLLVRELKKP